MNWNLKLFHEAVLRDIKRCSAMFMTTTSDKMSDAIAQSKAANEKVLKDFAKLTEKFAKEIDEKCGNLSSVDVLSNINQKIEQLRAKQIEAAKKLSAIPEKYEKEMQSNYVQIEDIIGTAN